MIRRHWVMLALFLAFHGDSLAQGSSAESAQGEGAELEGRNLYVRQMTGKDRNDGLSPQTALRSLSALGHRLRPGDVAYVGPGQYRESLVLLGGGTAEQPITLVGDNMGLHTGDPAGLVLIAGSDPIDETIFAPGTEAGVYLARIDGKPVLGVTEMDGQQFRYSRAMETRQHILEGMPPLEVVAQLPASYFWDEIEGILYIHTSDNRSANEHEIELIRRKHGIALNGTPFVVVKGFNIRHFSGAGIGMFPGSSNAITLQNTTYGCDDGIRAVGSAEVLVVGNISFRNGNSGIYFLSGSTDGVAVDNVVYENVKGIRWGSRSDRGLLARNLAFHNLEAGISIERASVLRLISNSLVGNRETQFQALQSDYYSEGNCFEVTGPSQLTVSLDHHRQFRALGEFRDAFRMDLTSANERCRALANKVNVEALHAQAMALSKRDKESNTSNTDFP